MLSLKTVDTLVLSGGGFKGFLQLGSLHFLITKGLDISEINVFSGCSIGSVICLLLAIGYTPMQIFEKVSKTALGSLVKINSIQKIYSKTGILSIDEAFVFLDNLVIEKLGTVPTLKELKDKLGKTVYSCVLNLDTGACQYLSWKSNPDMLCTKAAKLSSNLPIIFEKIIENGETIVDGGLRNAIPYEPVYSLNNNILAIATPGASSLSTEGMGYIHNVISTSINALMDQRLSKVPKDVNLLVLRKDGIPIFDVNSSFEDQTTLFMLGHDRTQKIFETEYIQIDLPKL